MNPLGGRLNESVWHITEQTWGRYVGPDPADPASTCFVQWAPGDDPVRVPIDVLLVSDHPSAGQVDRPAPDSIEVRAGTHGSDQAEQTLWYVPRRRPENRRAEAYSLTQRLVGAGLADWAEADYGADEPARTQRSQR